MVVSIVTCHDTVATNMHQCGPILLPCSLLRKLSFKLILMPCCFGCFCAFHIKLLVSLISLAFIVIAGMSKCLTFETVQCTLDYIDLCELMNVKLLVFLCKWVMSACLQSYSILYFISCYHVRQSAQS